MTAKEVRKFVKELQDLSTIPAILGKLLSMIKDENSSPQDLYRLISHDQAFAERVVRVANSALFGHSGQIKDIRQAIMFLGYNRIKSIALGMTIMDIFPSKAFNIKNLWVHSYEVAFISASISEFVPMTSPRECFLAGLLHDVGRIIFYKLDQKGFLSLGTGDDLFEREKEVFDCTHAEAGAWFAEESELPDEIVKVIRFHHKPSMTDEYRDSVSIVSMGEALSRRFSPRIEDDGIWTEEHDALLLEYSLNDSDLAAIGERFYGIRGEIERFFE